MIQKWNDIVSNATTATPVINADIDEYIKDNADKKRLEQERKFFSKREQDFNNFINRSMALQDATNNEILRFAHANNSLHTNTLNAYRGLTNQVIDLFNRTAGFSGGQPQSNGLSQITPIPENSSLVDVVLGGPAGREESNNNPLDISENEKELSFGRFQQNARDGGLDEMYNMAVQRAAAGDPYFRQFVEDFGPIRINGSFKRISRAALEPVLKKAVREGYWDKVERPVVFERYYKRALEHLLPEARKWVESNPYLQQFLFSRAIQMGYGDGTNGASGMINTSFKEYNGDTRSILKDAFDAEKAANSRWHWYATYHPKEFNNMVKKRFTRELQYYLSNIFR